MAQRGKRARLMQPEGTAVRAAARLSLDRSRATPGALLRRAAAVQRATWVQPPDTQRQALEVLPGLTLRRVAEVRPAFMLRQVVEVRPAFMLRQVVEVQPASRAVAARPPAQAQAR
jgi:hypothetical protein